MAVEKLEASKRRAAADRGRERSFVEIVEFAADRNAMREAGDLDLEIGQKTGDVMRGRLPIDGGVEREDHFLDVIVPRPARTRLARFRSFGPMPSSGDKSAAEHMIARTQNFRAFERPKIGDRLDDDERLPDRGARPGRACKDRRCRYCRRAGMSRFFHGLR